MDNVKFILKNTSIIDKKIIDFLNYNIKRSSYIIELSNLLHNIYIAIYIENSIVEHAINYINMHKMNNKYAIAIYNDTYINIINNLDVKSHLYNESLYNNLKNKKVDPKMIAFYLPFQIFPEKWCDIMNKKKYIEKTKNNFASTDIYTCFKCGKKKCSIIQIQTRSADEPMTNFVTCLTCHNTFTK
jgi:DNA-directed RNA polymerase subunit M/transcription elongation factor TFIIS